MQQDIDAIVGMESNPQFMRWFGKSRVVDTYGNPKLVYHGTRVWDGGQGDVHAFNRKYTAQRFDRAQNIDMIGSWFSSTASADGAYKYAGLRANPDNINGVIYPVYLALHSPKHYGTFDDLLADFRKFHSEGAAIGERERNLHNGMQGDADGFQRHLKSEGYDGIHIPAAPFGDYAEFSKQDIWIAFSPEQVCFALSPHLHPELAVAPSSCSANPPTERFRSWFGDSKIVDAAGRPLVAYHGTTSDVLAFDRSKIQLTGSEAGFFFTENAARAEPYATGPGGNVMPVYLSITNPFVIDPLQWMDGKYQNDDGPMVDVPSVQHMICMGYDGVIINGDATSASEASWEFGDDVFIAFHPNQIKSAIGNTGRFDPASPSLTDNPWHTLEPQPHISSILQPHPTPGPASAFEQWFGRSEVVDAHGRPLVVFHGTSADFRSFSADKHRSILNNNYQGDGFHFSADPAVASRYAEASRNQFLDKERVLSLVDQKLPPLAAKTFRTVVTEGYSAAWDLPIEAVRAILDESTAAGIDLNDLLDIAEHVEGTAYNKGRERAFDASMIFGGTSHSLPDWVREHALRFGLEDALPSPNVIPAYLKVEKLLRTADRAEARTAAQNGYDGVYFTGDDLVGGEPEFIVFRPEQIKSAIGNSGRFDPASPDLTDSTATAALGYPAEAHPLPVQTRNQQTSTASADFGYE